MGRVRDHLEDEIDRGTQVNKTIKGVYSLLYASNRKTVGR